ncbi:hypothetical protein [Mycolicibacterium brumae]|uniref:Glycoprotein n=1 Tax=Mycolicibacterium brumae TaxID=85968 RepID=A0A2G5P5Q8_9MYCO|nr:hypothetical protein [Mycolicibacterium brumae]MCV7192177.1 hypothetical protein [Mycolicibacterium brumae]PIB73597.1 hypothetical protein CQY22_016315 [Mycolicibacterium brumae]UWW10696.1 hypothetical protein L2Z93_003834 [Mycolicibacterium brumae]
MIHPRGRSVWAVLVVLLLVLAPAALPPRAAAEPETQFLRVELSRVTPELVDTASDPTVTVEASIVNVGDRPVNDVVARLERAQPLAATTGLRTTLTEVATTGYEPVGPFLDIPGPLQPGERASVRFDYPLRSVGAESLGIDHPGVYPLLVNVNGTPDFGSPARLADTRFLLPVLGAPSASGDPESFAGPDDATGPDVVIVPDTTRPVRLTMLWPLADRPRLAPGLPGGATPIRLIDDELATELSPGGRLDALLSTVEFATAAESDPDGDLTGALCLAVDPDLLVTVNAMTGGYLVPANPDGTGDLRPGTGEAAAVAWLDRLRKLADRMCVTALPYAQTDLDAVQRVGDDQLSAFATTGAEDLVDQLLGVTSLRGLTVFGDGPLTPDALALLNHNGTAVAIAPASATAESTPDLGRRRVSDQVAVAPFDPSVAATLGALGDQPVTPGYLDTSLVPDRPESSAAARRQDAVGAVLWQSLHPDAEPRDQILAPPPNWGVSPDDATAVLRALSTLLGSGLATPLPLPNLIAETATLPGPPTPVDEFPTAARFDDSVIGAISDQSARLRGLTEALGTNAQTGLTGQAYTAPLREDMLRALSQSQPLDDRNGRAHRALQSVGGTIADLFGAVQIINPGGSYTLATERSPLPLAFRNDLAVPIRVRLLVDGPPGMTVGDVGELELPPGFLPVKVPIEVHFTQRFAVDVAVQTPGGLPLGEPVRLSLHSNAYGKVLFFVTLVAGATLALLTGRRLWHRFRGRPDRADLEPPEADHLHWPHRTPEEPGGKP